MKSSRIYIIIIFFNFIFISNSLGMTAQDLKDACSNKEEWASKTTYCYGVIQGTLSAYSYFISTYNINKEICFDDGVNIKKLSNIFIKYIGEHPEQEHLIAATPLINSMVKTFPCTD